MSEIRTGLGWDVHRIAPGRPLILGGVTVPSEFGLEGHSDADVLAHAITDAILGAAALGDRLRAMAEGNDIIGSVSSPTRSPAFSTSDVDLATESGRARSVEE